MAIIVVRFSTELSGKKSILPPKITVLKMAIVIKCKYVLLNMLLLSGEKQHYVSNGKICELNKDFFLKKNTHKQHAVRPGKEALMQLQR